jgi:hypothetical protein
MTTYLDDLAHAIRALIPDEVGVPDDADDLFALYALLGRAKGTQVAACDVHDAWVLWMQSRGEEHASMVPFEDLDRETQHEDEPFAWAIRVAVRRLRAPKAVT